MAEPLVTIVAFRDLPQALLAQGKLQSEGIECVLADDNVVRMDWFWANAMGGVKLRVRPGDADRAMQILSEEIPPSLATDTGEEFVQPVCPKCRSLDVRYDSPMHGVQLAALSVAAIPIPAGQERWMCEACGAEWEVVPEPNAEGERS